MTKELIVMQGIPGAGKDWVAKRDYRNHTICSADDYFRLTNPEYDMGGNGFDPSKLGEAHRFCFTKFMATLQAGDNCVVNNTNLDDVSIAPYIAVARHYGYDTTICRVKCDSATASGRNLHGVPEGVYDRMTAQFNKWKLNWIFKNSGVKLRRVNNNVAGVY
tara:strand:- start:164 stop:649 length:486 start_codon:yes stop_codon:yes gene_type:complete